MSALDGSDAEAPDQQGSVALPEKRPATPGWPSLTATALTVVSAILFLAVRDAMGAFLAGYLLASVIVPALVVLHRALNQRVGQDEWHRHRSWPDALANVVLILGLCVGTAHAWFLATEIAK